MAQKGLLPAFKVGGQWRFKRDIDGSAAEARREGRGGTPDAKDLAVLCETAASLYHRLVLVVGQPRSGKTHLLQAAVAANGWPLINLNQQVSEHLLELTQRQRALRLPRIVGDVLSSAGSEIVLVDNIELLFSPDLQQDPLKLLQGAARNRTIVASWPGALSGRQLRMSQAIPVPAPTLAELDTLCLSMPGDAGPNAHAEG